LKAADSPGGLNWWWPALVGAVLLAAIAGALWLHQLVAAQSGQFMSVAGDVQTRAARESAPWLAAASGDRIKAGEHVRAGAGGLATLHFGHPSTLRLETAGEWTLSAVRHSRSGDYGRVVVSQHAGRASYVSPLPQDNLDINILIQVPGGTVTVQGAATLTTRGETTSVHLLEGTAVILTPTEYLVIPSGHTAVIAPDQPVAWPTATPTP
jgi:hypothetical protein